MNCTYQRATVLLCCVWESESVSEWISVRVPSSRMELSCKFSTFNALFSESISAKYLSSLHFNWVKAQIQLRCNFRNVLFIHRAFANRCAPSGSMLHCDLAFITFQQMQLLLWLQMGCYPGAMSAVYHLCTEHLLYNWHASSESMLQCPRLSSTKTWFVLSTSANAVAPLTPIGLLFMYNSCIVSFVHKTFANWDTPSESMLECPRPR